MSNYVTKIKTTNSGTTTTSDITDLSRFAIPVKINGEVQTEENVKKIVINDIHVPENIYEFIPSYFDKFDCPPSVNYIIYLKECNIEDAWTYNFITDQTAFDVDEEEGQKYLDSPVFIGTFKNNDFPNFGRLRAKMEIGYDYIDGNLTYILGTHEKISEQDQRYVDKITVDVSKTFNDDDVAFDLPKLPISTT